MFFASGFYTTGKTLVVELQQVSYAGVASTTWWNNTTGAWAVNPSEVDRRIPLTESDQTYIGGKSILLGTYSGPVFVHFYEVPVSGPVVKLATEVAYFDAGNQIIDPVIVQDLSDDWKPSGSLGISLASAASGGTLPNVSVVAVDPSRTFVIGNDSERPESINVVTVGRGSECTIAFDFSRTLNDHTSVYSVHEVTVLPETISLGAAAPSQSRRQVHVKVSDLETAGEYTLTCMVNTTETGERLSATGVLVVI